MPRPGPRPYECVRRAWHSDRHQPVRGLIIQQIFRFVHENHSAATKKNKEWLEKLPIVVLKAEEIIYSKANSEAEYSNIETLWDRVNDAIDTIIRKDESTESGELLPPCVEAALNLGCVAMRASRSQRHNNPTTYLRSSYQDCNDMSTKYLNENANEHNSAQTSNTPMLKMPGNVDSSRLAWESNKRIAPNSTHYNASSFEKPHSKNNIEVDINTPLNRCSVYPLYYGTSFGNEVSQSVFREPKKPNSIIIGVPVFSSMSVPTEGGCLQNLFPYHDDKNVAKETSEAATAKGKGPDIGFDLSLRLGLFSESGSTTDKVGHRVSHNEGSLPKEEFPFFPMESAYNRNSGLVSRAHKRPFSGDVESDQFFWSQDSTSNRFAGQMRRPGL